MDLAIMLEDGGWERHAAVLDTDYLMISKKFM